MKKILLILVIAAFVSSGVAYFGTQVMEGEQSWEDDPNNLSINPDSTDEVPDFPKIGKEFDSLEDMKEGDDLEGSGVSEEEDDSAGAESSDDEDDLGGTDQEMSEDGNL